MNRTRCEHKGHVDRCPVHPNRYLKPGAECPTCKAEYIAKRRAELKEKEEKKSPEKEVKPKKETERKYRK